MREDSGPPRRLVSPTFHLAASYLLDDSALLPWDVDLVRVEDTDVGPILTHPDDHVVGRSLRVDKTWSPSEGRFLRQRLHRGMNALDIGANIGYFALMMARLVGPDGRVLAVEAEPDIFQLLRANVALNDCRNIDLLPLAAHHTPGLVTSSRHPQNHGASTVFLAGAGWRQSPVQAVRLDDVLDPHVPIHIIKIDIEGMDHAAVQGLEQTIRRWGPTLLVELNPGGTESFGDSPLDVLHRYRAIGMEIRLLGWDLLRLQQERGTNIDDLILDNLMVHPRLDETLIEWARLLTVNLILTPGQSMSKAAIEVSGKSHQRRPLVAPTFQPAARYLIEGPSRLPRHVDFVRVEHTDVGTMWTHPGDEVIGHHLRAHKTWAQAESRFLRSRLQPGMNAIDVGANIGYFTLLMARAVGPTGRVLAIEAEPEIFQTLRANVGANHLENVDLLPIAAHRQQGLVITSHDPTNHGASTAFPYGGWQMSPVQAMPLDEVLDPDVPIHIVKIDVEGMDHAAVQGLERTIRRWEPVLLVEFNPRTIEDFGERPQAVLPLYRSIGLEICVLGGDALRLQRDTGLVIDELLMDNLVVHQQFDAQLIEHTRRTYPINLVLSVR